MKKFLTARTTVLALFLVLAACLCLPLIIPQQTGGIPALSPADGYPLLAAVARAAGLDHVFSTWWFLLVAGLFLLSLSCSTFDQYRLARKRTVAEGRLHYAEETPLAVSADDFGRFARRCGYLPIGRAAAGARYVKSPWGYWGNFLLHLGLTLTVLFALVYVVTEHRLAVRVIAGEETPLTPETAEERKGLLAGTLPLPRAIRLGELSAAFWENDQLRELSSTGTFLQAGGGEEPYRIGINEKLSRRGVIVYQKGTFGTAFSLTFVDPAGRSFEEVFLLPQPQRRDKPGYGEMPLAGDGYTLKGKYLPDASGQSVLPRDPELTLRLVAGGAPVGEVSLKTGESGSLGPFRVTLRKTAWWTEYLFEGSRGVAGIFTGFALILLGVLLTYFSVPRVVTIVDEGGGRRVTWQSARFNDFFRAERDRIFAAARGEELS